MKVEFRVLEVENLKNHQNLAKKYEKQSFFNLHSSSTHFLHWILIEKIRFQRDPVHHYIVGTFARAGGPHIVRFLKEKSSHVVWILKAYFSNFFFIISLVKYSSLESDLFTRK